ncbi:MAG TPA: hypothetical protein VIK78_15585 [Ruminiclostridium sp.]
MCELYNLIIVDDELFIRTGLASYNWKQLGYKVAGIASDGKECLDFMENIQVDAIIKCLL